MNEIYTANRERSQTENSLGIRLGNRCKTVFDTSQLVVAGGALDGQIAKSRHLQSSLLQARVPEFDSLSDQLKFTKDLPGIFESFLFTGKRAREEGYIKALGGEDLQNLIPIGFDIALQKDVSQTALRVVYGATENMPFRGLSYILPGLISMENMQQRGIALPQLQIVFAHRISTVLNRLDYQKVQSESKKLGAVIKAYIGEYFPELEGSVTLLEDTGIDDTQVGKDLEEIGSKIEEFLPAAAELLRKKGENNGENGNSLLYGGAHLLVHDQSADDLLSPLFPQEKEAIVAKNVISIGGMQERFFYDLRHALKPFVDERFKNVRTLQYFTRHSVPPYYMARGGDVSLEAVLTGFVDSQPISKTATIDLDYLRKVSSFRGNFHAFLHPQQEGRLS